MATATETPLPPTAEAQAAPGAAREDASQPPSQAQQPMEMADLHTADAALAAAAATSDPRPELSSVPTSTSDVPLDTPTLRITLMLTTGSRHAYTLTQKYLTSRKVEAKDSNGAFDPREMSGYKLKELIWTDWRPEWEPRSRDPSSIRLIIMGRMIDDKVALKDLPFSLAAANVVHMTVKPADLVEDEVENAGKGGKGSIRANNAGEEGGAGCRCVVM